MVLQGIRAGALGPKKWLEHYRETHPERVTEENAMKYLKEMYLAMEAKAAVEPATVLKWAGLSEGSLG